MRSVRTYVFCRAYASIANIFVVLYAVLTKKLSHTCKMTQAIFRRCRHKYTMLYDIQKVTIPTSLITMHDIPWVHRYFNDYIVSSKWDKRTGSFRSKCRYTYNIEEETAVMHVQIPDSATTWLYIVCSAGEVQCPPTALIIKLK